MSKIIKAKIKAANGSFLANDNISEFINEYDLKEIQDNVEQAMVNLLDALVIDTENDHNTIETAKRVAKMYVHEVFKGRYLPAPKITDFPNAKNLDQIYTIGPITVRSACSHHLVPIMGQAWIGVIPGERVIGISKFNRLTEWIMARPQIQEESTVQLADEIEKIITPKALAVVVKAQHMCMSWRGVRDTGSSMTTSVMRGLFRNDIAAREEFLSIIKGQGF
jgi:GTP cyclohydrolase I